MKLSGQIFATIFKPRLVTLGSRILILEALILQLEESNSGLEPWPHHLGRRSVESGRGGGVATLRLALPQRQLLDLLALPWRSMMRAWELLGGSTAYAFLPMLGCLPRAGVAIRKYHEGPCGCPSLRGTSPEVGCKPKGVSGALFVGLASWYSPHLPAISPRGSRPWGGTACCWSDFAYCSFDEIQASQTPTLRHVPKAARHLWGPFTRCLASVVHHHDATAWQELLMLPKTVLDTPRRGGRQHQKAAATL